jgi:pyruvate/2-oxoglutarate dehydrogenase complex dihydrolipoamide acyltransferase (E2) component
MAKIILPELGENIKKATVSYWYFKVGDKVNKDDDLVELTTDKATFNIPSPSSGVISHIIASEGETVEVGSVLGDIQ